MFGLFGWKPKENKVYQNSINKGKFIEVYAELDGKIKRATFSSSKGWCQIITADQKMIIPMVNAKFYSKTKRFKIKELNKSKSIIFFTVAITEYSDDDISRYKKWGKIAGYMYESRAFVRNSIRNQIIAPFPTWDEPPASIRFKGNMMDYYGSTKFDKKIKKTTVKNREEARVMLPYVDSCEVLVTTEGHVYGSTDAVKKISEKLDKRLLVGLTMFSAEPLFHIE